MTGNRWETEGREHKIARYVAGFNLGITGDAGRAPTPEQAEEALRQLDAAGEEQWKLLKEQMQEKRIASPATRAGIRSYYAAIANRRFAKGDLDVQEPGRERYEIAGDVDGHSYRVEASHDKGSGYMWRLYAGERFLRSGYTRGSDLLLAFRSAREVFTALLTQAGAEAAQ